VAGKVDNDPTKGPVDPHALTAADLQLRAEIILRFFKEQKTKDPTFRIPTITFHHVHAYDPEWRGSTHRNRYQPFPMGALMETPKTSEPA